VWLFDIDQIGLSVILRSLHVCHQDYSKSNQPIALKLGTVFFKDWFYQSEELVKFWW